MSTAPDRDRAFNRVLVEGTAEAIAAWIGTGPDAVHRLHQELTGERRISIPDDTHDRILLDNLSTASYQAAGAFPDEFLAAFADSRWDATTFVCCGLGAIRRTEVTERLFRILGSTDPYRRVDAAVALRGHRHPDMEAVLVAALQDPDEIVRYHVEERLAELNSGTIPDP